MAGCYFRATGGKFDVDSFLIGSSLDIDDVYHRGEPIGRKGRLRPFTGFSVVVSETWGDLRPQIADTIAFLRENESELSRLARYPGVTDMRFDFPYERRECAVVQCDFLPPELLALAGALGIGIEMSLYPGESEWNEMVNSFGNKD